MVKNKYHKNISYQVILLKKAYPDAFVNSKFNKHLEFISWIPSSPLGKRYKIRIKAILGKKIEVFVINPRKLEFANGLLKLPHVYCQKRQKLCLFYPKNNEWSFDQIIANTILPWTMEWLLNYEIWLHTGKWLGGGIEH